MMKYRMYANDQLFYRSDLDEEEYQVLDIEVDEEINKTATLQFVMLPTNIMYDGLVPMSTVIKLVSDTREIFRGRVVTCGEMDIYGQRTVKCENPMSYLMDSVFIPEKAASPTKSSSSSSGESVENPTDDISTVIQKITNGDYGSAVETVWSKLTHAASETWTKVKTASCYTYDYFANGGSVSGFVSNIGENVRNWLSGYYSDDSGGGSGGGGGTTSVKEKAKDFFARVLLSHNLQVEPYKRIWPGEVTIDDAETEDTYGGDSVCDSYSALDGGLRSRFKGYFRLRYDENDDCFLDYIKDYDSECSQMIQLGVNMMDLSYKESHENLFSVLMPLGKNDGTIASVNDGNVFLEVPEYIAEYGHVTLIKSFDDIEDAAALKQAGLDYIDKHCNGVPVNMDVTALDMHLVDHEVDEIELGNRINVYAPMRNIDTVKMVKKIHRVIQKPDNTTYTIGDDEENDLETTASYRTTSGKSGSRLYVDDDDILTRDNLKFRLAGQFDLLASNIVLHAKNNLPEYASKNAYEKGKTIQKDGLVYKAKENIDADSEWDASKWEPVEMDIGTLYMISDIEKHKADIIEITTDILDLYGTASRTEQAILRIQDSLAGDFDDDEAYAPDGAVFKKGDWIWKDGQLYIAKEDNIKKSDGWIASKWAEPNPENGFIGINGTLYATRAYVTDLIATRIQAVEADIERLTSSEAIVRKLQSTRIYASAINVGSVYSSGNIIASGGVQGGSVYSGGDLCATQNWVNNKGYVIGPLNTTYVEDGQGHMVQVYCP